MSVAQASISIKVEGVVSVSKCGENEFHWTRTRHAGSVSTRSREIFTSEWEAWLAALSIARADGFMLQAPDEIRVRLVAHINSQRQGVMANA